MEEQKLGKADLHVHSIFSYDGFNKPEMIVKQASKIGLDVIAITDHDNIKGAISAQKFENKYGVEVVIGEEVLTNEGEILGLFLKEEVKPGKTLKETIKIVHDQEGIVIIPHPFSFFPLTRPAIGVKLLYSLLKEKNLLPEGMEVLNSMPSAKLSSKKSRRLNEKIFNFAEVAGSDAHIEKHIGMGITLFPGQTKEDLKKAIINCQTRATGDFVSGKEHAEIIRKNIVRMSKTAGSKLLKPYHKLKNSIQNKFHHS